jgi:hypothetical protein
VDNGAGAGATAALIANRAASYRNRSDDQTPGAKR